MDISGMSEGERRAGVRSEFLNEIVEELPSLLFYYGRRCMNKSQLRCRRHRDE